MKYFIFSLFIFLSLTSTGQPAFAWAKSMGAGNYDEGRDVAVDASGNVYTTGWFFGTVDFDPGTAVCNLTSVGGYENIFISKFDASGAFVWAKSMGGAASVEGVSLTLDAAGNIYTSGIFYGIADFDPGTGVCNLISKGGADIFVCKLDASGTFLLAKGMGGINDDLGYSIAVDTANNIYTTGFFSDTTDFDPGAGVYNLVSMGGSHDVFVSKLDASGSFVWAKSFGGSAWDYAQSIAIDPAGNIYTTGAFSGTVDFDPDITAFNITSAGYMDGFISKLDASGSFIWAKQFGAAGNGTECFSIALDQIGNVFTTGYFNGIVDFDPGGGNYNLVTAGGGDIFVSKLNSSGNFLWAKNMGGTGSEIGHSIAVDPAGNIYTTGEFNDIADFDPGTGVYYLTSTGTPSDLFISKLDPSGTFMWAKSIGAPDSTYGYSIGYSIFVDLMENIYAIGSFGGTVDFDPDTSTYNLASVYVNDIFVLKLSDANVGIADATSDLKKAVIVFPNPSSGVFTIILDNTATETKICIYNVLGNCVLNKLSAKNSELEIDLSNQSKGIYFLEIVSDSEKAVKKIILN